jgi:transposase-like protein
MYKNDKVIRRYSESFKLKILDELTTRKLNKYQLEKDYGINSTTINEWIRKFLKRIVLERTSTMSIMTGLVVNL